MSAAVTRMTTTHGLARGVRCMLGFLVALVAAWAIAPASASATACTPGNALPLPTIPVPGSCFEGYDGDQVDSDGAGAGNPRLDWQSVLSLTGSAADFVQGGNDSQFGAGGTEEVPDSWTFDFGSLGSDKYDIINGYLAQEPNTADLFLALAFIR